MATLYPAALDNLPTINPNDSKLAPSHADVHTDANDAINAIQEVLGVNPARIYYGVAPPAEGDIPVGVHLFIDTSGVTPQLFILEKT